MPSVLDNIIPCVIPPWRYLSNYLSLFGSPVIHGVGHTVNGSPLGPITPQMTYLHATHVTSVTGKQAVRWRCQSGPRPGPRFNINISSYQYRKSHCGDKTVVRSSYLHNRISYTGKMTSLYWDGPQTFSESSLTARFLGPTWSPPGADRSHVGPMLSPWTLLSGSLQTGIFHHNIWRLICQKQVSQTGIRNYITWFTVGCNYLSLPKVPASGNKLLCGM